MPATLLAVDDSQTMRKVLEMTFAGEDVRVVTADSFDAALALVRSEDPALVVADVTLPGKSGYDLCQAIKQANPGLPVLLLSSKLHPYDPGKGQAARADGNLDKPFDTQQIIDRVKGLLSGERRAAPEPPRAAQAAPRVAAPTPYRAPSPLSSTMVGAPSARPSTPKAAPVSSPSPGRPAPGAPAQQDLRSTIDFSSRQESPVRPAPAPAPAAARAPTPAPTPAARPAAPAPAAAAPVAAAVAAKVGGDMPEKLKELGLSKDQIDAVLALSHDVIERVVWEVVPVLAETMIKEEIKRLMAD